MADFRITRRALLGAGAALALPLPRIAWAQLATLQMGDATLMTLSDGGLMLPPGEPPSLDATAAEVEALFAESGFAQPELRPVTVTLLRTGDRVVLFDVGSGSNFMPTTGELPAALEAAGVTADEITDVALTHAHPDHLWGAIDEFDEIAFPNATFHVAQPEWDFWMSDDALSQVDPSRQMFVVGAKSRFEAIAEQVSFFEPGAEVAPGIESVATFGHTPGHVSYAVHAGGDSVMVVGDALTHPVLSFRRPQWRAPLDQIPEMAAETRAALLDRLSADRMRLIGYHLPEPGIGYAEKAADGWTYVPA
jgi:glyoxylase-like metal-dependent hydrolase (beta-lactamase superfamily II)